MSSNGLEFCVRAVGFIVSLLILIQLLTFRIRYKFLPGGLIGVLLLVAHITAYYVVVLLRYYGVFDIVGWLNGLLNHEVMSMGLWSSAIRLQAIMELLLMTLTHIRRHQWINSTLN